MPSTGIFDINTRDGERAQCPTAIRRITDLRRRFREIPSL